MNLLKHVNRLFLKAIKDYAETNGITIRDPNEFVHTKGKAYVVELSYLYLSYEENLFLTICSIIHKEFPEDYEFEILYEPEPAPYLILGDFDIGSMYEELDATPNRCNLRVWKFIAAEAHYRMQHEAEAMGFFHIAKKAKVYRARLTKHLGLE